MDAELSPEEFEVRLARNLDEREREVARLRVGNRELRELIEKKKALAGRLRSFLTEIETESARLDAAIAQVTSPH